MKIASIVQIQVLFKSLKAKTKQFLKNSRFRMVGLQLYSGLNTKWHPVQCLYSVRYLLAVSTSTQSIFKSIAYSCFRYLHAHNLRLGQHEMEDASGAPSPRRPCPQPFFYFALCFRTQKYRADSLIMDP